jgi:hypothetical protein
MGDAREEDFASGLARMDWGCFWRTSIVVPQIPGEESSFPAGRLAWFSALDHRRTGLSSVGRFSTHSTSAEVSPI